MAVQTEPNRLNDFLKGEQDQPPHFSREKVTIESGEELSLGAVVSKKTFSVPATGTADGGNTGNGTCTGVSGGEDTGLGIYTLTCKETAADGGKFKVVDPDGESLPDAEVGAAYVNDQINFTLNDGTTDFAAGDKFTIEVVAGSGKVVEIDFSAVDGSQNAHGITIDACDATAGDTEGVLIVRNATIIAANLVWPDGVTEAQKTNALRQLAAKGIIEREEV